MTDAITPSSSHDPDRLRRRRRRASGFTPPEVLVAMTVAGTLVAVIATAITVMLRTTPNAEIRLAESKDVTFLQTWVPVDLATAINSYDDHLDAVVKADLAANDPFVSYNSVLPGTNVLTLVVPNSDTGLMEIVSYRYVEKINEPGVWQLARYAISNPGTGSESTSRVGVAHEVPSPPDGWVPGDDVGFAFQVIARNQARVRPVGEDVVVFFESGNEFRTGGAGLSAEQDLTPLDPITLPDPIAPPSRCGGPVALMLDTSFSVPRYNGGAALEAAATGFIDAFTGTPTDLAVMGFDAIGYQLYPNLNGERGTYFSLLDDQADADGNTVPDVQDAKNNILALPDVDTTVNQSNEYYHGDRTAAIGWTQFRTSENGVYLNEYYYSGTNWHDAMHSPFFTQDGALRARTPELLVFVTDGQPNVQRSDMFEAPTYDDVLTPAIEAANAGRSTGARIVGVYVGPDDATLEQQLADVVGSNKWDGGPAENPAGNAASADYFAGSFAQLGNILRQIVVAQCGGTVTVRKEMSGGGSASGQWNYSSETGDQVLDLAATSSITFDYSFDGEPERTISIREEVKDGFTFNGFECKLRGEVLDPNAADPKVRSTTVDGVPGVEIDLSPDEAVSCTFFSVPE